MNSSTSSSEILDGVPSRWPVEAVVAVLLLLMVEGWLHFARPFSGAEQDDFRAAIVHKAIETAEAIDALDVAVIGSSVTSAVRAESLEGARPGSVVRRFELYSANAARSLQMLDAVVLRNHRPQDVIYVASPRDANVAGTLATVNAAVPDLDRYQRSRIAYWSHRWVQENFLLVRWREPLAARLRGVLRPVGAAGSVGAAPATAKGSAGPLDEFQADPRFESAVLQMHRLAMERGVGLQVVMIPMNPSPAVVSARFHSDSGNWIETMVIELRHAGVQVVNARSILDRAEYFKDSHHLSDAGKDRLEQSGLLELRGLRPSQ